jgi:hypothetical protein
MGALRVVLVLTTLLIPVSAGAVTVRDIIELTRAGLSDDVLIAVIEADRTVFTLDKDQILELKAAGVSKKVLLKMLRTRREHEAPQYEPPQYEPPQYEAAQPGLVVIETPPPATPPVTVVVPQYLYVPYPIWGVPARRGPRPAPAPVIAPEYRGFGRFINDGWVDRSRPQ